MHKWWQKYVSKANKANSATNETDKRKQQQQQPQQGRQHKGEEGAVTVCVCVGTKKWALKRSIWRPKRVASVKLKIT